jgi:hypothetical protein
MAITIKKASTMKELKRFIRFNYRLYKGNPYSVPDLYDDMLNTFNKKKNAAFEFCEAEYFLAYKDNQIVGRVKKEIRKQIREIKKQYTLEDKKRMSASAGSISSMTPKFPTH